MPVVSELVEAWRREFELREQRDWSRYALGAPLVDGPWLAARCSLAALAGRPDTLEALERHALRSWGARLAVDLDPEVVAATELADRLEEEGADRGALEAALVRVFARRELLARRAGYAGYVELALRAERLSLASVVAELSRADELARCDAAVPPDYPQDIVFPVPDQLTLWEHLRVFFTPLLDDVELRVDSAVRISGMCKVCRWPRDIRVAVRGAGASASPAARLRALGVLAHEAGHAVHFRLLAQRECTLLEFAATSAVEQETYADACERLVFETGLNGRLKLPLALRRWWQRQRADLVRGLVGRAHFELQAYAAALDAPATLQALWRGELTRMGAPPPAGAAWAEDGHGFYTEDPLRRCAYPLAYARSADRWPRSLVQSRYGFAKESKVGAPLV
jgi:hypothetical protein